MARVADPLHDHTGFLTEYVATRKSFWNYHCFLLFTLFFVSAVHFQSLSYHYKTCLFITRYFYFIYASSTCSVYSPSRGLILYDRPRRPPTWSYPGTKLCRLPEFILFWLYTMPETGAKTAPRAENQSSAPKLGYKVRQATQFRARARLGTSGAGVVCHMLPPVYKEGIFLPISSCPYQYLSYLSFLLPTSLLGKLFYSHDYIFLFSRFPFQPRPFLSDSLIPIFGV